MHILWTILVGFAAGVVAKLIHPGRDNMGFILTTLLGIAGSFIGGLISSGVSSGGQFWVFRPAHLLWSIVGAFVLLLIVQFAMNRRHRVA